MAHQHPDRPEVALSDPRGPDRRGAVAQLGERRLCKAEVGGSSPPGSTNQPRVTTAGHHISGIRSCGASRRQRPGRERSAPRQAPSQRKSARAQNKLRETQLEYYGERETAGRPWALEVHGWVRRQLRSRECLTKGQATKGARRMPRRHGPMKDVARLRKAPASCLASSTGDLRMGQPGPLYRGSRPAKHIGRIEGTGGTETSQYPEEKKRFP